MGVLAFSKNIEYRGHIVKQDNYAYANETVNPSVNGNPVMQSGINPGASNGSAVNDSMTFSANGESEAAHRTEANFTQEIPIPEAANNAEVDAEENNIDM